MKAKKWFHKEGSVELLEICGERCNSKGFKRTICELATTILRAELDKFIATRKIHQPTTTITPERLTTFSLHTLSETMIMHAPLLWHLFQRLLETPNSHEHGVRKGAATEEVEWLESSDEEMELSTEGHLEKNAARRSKQKTVRW